MQGKARVLVEPHPRSFLVLLNQKRKAQGSKKPYATKDLTSRHHLWELPFRFTISTLGRNTTSHFRSFPQMRCLLRLMSLLRSVLSIKPTPDQRFSVDRIHCLCSLLYFINFATQRTFRSFALQRNIGRA
jgi:hypothetical protein